jgi:hypothetical protein
MATPLNPPSTSDIGPLSDSSILGEPGRAPASAAVAASARKPRADSGDPAIEPANESPAEETPRDFNGAGATNSDARPVTEETPRSAAEEKKESTTRQEAPPPPPVTLPENKTGGQQANVGKPWPPLDYSQEHDKVEAELLERMRAKYGITLVNDMDDAQLLLSYVTRNGLQEDRKVSDATIQTLIAAREHMRSFSFNSENEEADFRKSCGIIAKAAEPVTVASLRDSTTTELRPSWLWCIGWWFEFAGIFRLLPREPRRRPVAEIACLRYRRIAVVVLVVLLLFQIYWTVTSSILNETDSLTAEINKAQPSRYMQYYLAQEAARGNALNALDAPRAQQASTPPATPSPASSAPATATAPASVPVPAPQPKPEETPAPSLTLEELLAKMGELKASHVMLHKVMPFLDAPALGKTAEEKRDPAATEARARTAKDIFTPTDLQIESAKLRTVAGQVVEVLQKWVLPLLYGALGAMVFVVRTLSVQARDRLFRREALVSLVLRVFLGMISGLAIGWFWSNDPQATTTGGEPLSLSTLSPFALAFVAGYGVELFFALLDKIVSTFTNK